MVARIASLRAVLAAAVVLLPARVQAQVPKPADVFGFRPGTDHELADHDQMLAYFDAHPMLPRP